MKTRSVLIRFPAYPIALADLMPDHRLASLAACLTQAGHRTRIADYGTLSVLARLFPKTEYEPRSRRFPLSSKLPETMLGLCRELAQNLGRDKDLSFLLIHIDSPDALRPSALLAEQLRGLRPSLPLWAYLAPPVWPTKRPKHYDSLFSHTDELTVVAHADRLGGAHREWGCQALEPGLAEPSRATTPGAHFSIKALPAPCYGQEHYPALVGDGKLKLFTVEETREFARSQNFLVFKPCRQVMDEVQGICVDAGARAVHFSSAAASLRHIEHVAQHLRAHRPRLLYSRHLRIDTLASADLPRLRQSGCAALSFQLDTGSQHLLDHYYGHAFTVTQPETMLRAAKRAGLYTLAALNYPCPVDDFHTRAETLRILERSRPDGAYLAMAGVAQTRLPITSPGIHPFRAARDPRSPDERRHEQQTLLHDIAQLQIGAGLTPPLVVMAQATGHGQREEEFGARLQRLFHRGDMEELQHWVIAFNRQAVPASASTAHSLTRAPHAIGEN